MIVSIEAIKKALESLKDFDTWELIPLFTYTNDDHRPTNRDGSSRSRAAKSSR